MGVRESLCKSTCSRIRRYKIKKYKVDL